MQNKDSLTENYIQFTFNFIRLYYDYLRKITYSVKFFIFFYIGYKKSGYINIWKKFCDSLIFSHKKLLLFLLLVSILPLILLIIKTELIISFYGGTLPFLLNLLNYVDIIKIYLNNRKRRKMFEKIGKSLQQIK